MLALQLLQARIFSVLYWNHLVYFIITMALLGLAAGGTVLSLSSKIKNINEKTFFSLCLSGFSVSTLLGTYCITKLSGDFFLFWESSGTLLNLVLSYFLAMFPFFFFGLFIANVFLKNPERSGTIYFCNLLGSAAGCLLYITLIKSLGAINLLLLIFITGSIAAILAQEIKRLPFVLIQVLSVVILSYWVASTMQILPETNKRFWSFKKPQVEFSQWNAISRVDVVSEKGNNQVKKIFIDGDALTPLVRTPPVLSSGKNGIFKAKTGIKSPSPHREAVYILSQDRKLNNVLVIGAGGGSDVLMAYKNDAAMIDAVEINPTTAEIVKKQFSPFIGRIFETKEVNLHLEDGRSFVRRSEKLYDVIMIYGVDSFAALSSGAYVLTESYLYTVEAVNDYWEHLSEEGILQISRWHYPAAPREILRAFITVYEALSKRGIDPSRHMLVVGDKSGDIPFADILISRRPFQEKDILKVDNWIQKHDKTLNWLGQQTGLHLIFNPLADSEPEKNPFYGFIYASRLGAAEKFLDDYQFNVRPVTDDDPFFFQYGRWSHALKPYPMGPGRFESIQGKWPFLVLLALTFQSILLAALLVWIPILKLQKNLKITVYIPVIFYFSLIGLAFIFVEMALIQKVVLLLGHPIYSMALTVPTILIAAGIGSICLEFLKVKAKSIVLSAVSGTCLFIALWIVASPSIFQMLLPFRLVIKIIAVVAFIFPLGFLMGFLFPLGISRLTKFPEMVPIAWAANGGMSVIGSIVAVVIAMTFGFSNVFSIAAVLYILAALCFLLKFKSWRLD